MSFGHESISAGLPERVLRALFLLFFLMAGAASADERLTLNFDPGWKFIKADPTNAFQAGFNDDGWSSVSLPHTYNDVDTFENWSLPGHRGEQNQWGGRTWYRKTFSLPETFKGRKVFIEFEAARQVAEVYLNGHFLGVSKTGFIPFGFDLTPWLRFDAPNVLAVMCDNRFMKDPLADAAEAPASKPAGGSLNLAPAASESLAALSAKVNAAIPADVDQLQADQIPWNNPHWHPAHGGIYRNVYLHVTDPLHISLPLYSFLQTAGPYVYTTDVSTNAAIINLEVPVENGRNSGEKIEVVAQILDRAGKVVLTLNQSGDIAGSAHEQFKLSGALNFPQLWEPDYPYLYHVAISLRVGGKTVDNSDIPLGIRTAHWDAKTGFWINGHHLKLHGWGQKPTDEWPGLGAAQPDWMHYYTLSLMKEAGGNWVRWGHCAAAPAMIEAGDQLGIMAEQPGVDGESDTVGAAWKVRAAAFRDMIIYFRNHPSIMIWEGGNQKVTLAHARELRGYMDEYDPHGGRAYAHRRADQTDAQFMDVCIGTEGGHEIPHLPVVEGEYDREESPRRVWDDFSPPNFGYPEAKGKSDYILTSEQYAANEVKQYVLKVGAPNHSGGANWIFSDSTSGGRDAAEVTRASGEVDGVRLPKEAYYVCQTMFRGDPQVHIIGHWNYPAGTKKTVYVTSNCEDVELFVNEKSLGHGKVSNRYLFTFENIAWEPGEIKAVAWKNGKAAVSASKHTVGPPVALRLTPILGPKGLQADGSDVALIDVEALDAKGERCPTFQQRVDFAIAGPGIWRGGYNSSKTNSINNQFLDLECGINRVAVRSTDVAGEITVTVHGGDLKPASTTVFSKPFATEHGYATQFPPLPPPPALARPVFEDSQTLIASEAKVDAGRFLAAFSYSGPAASVRVERDAHDGAKIYADRDFIFNELPAKLHGSDWVQTANADKLYSAVDLLDFSLNVNGVVYVAHDSRLPVPDWLQHQFNATEMSFLINGQPMKIFERHVRSGESLTLGSNTEDRRLKSCNMYVVFVKRDGPAIQATALFPSDPNLNRHRNPHPGFSGEL
jgi:beta-galactosidase